MKHSPYTIRIAGKRLNIDTSALIEELENPWEPAVGQYYFSIKGSSPLVHDHEGGHINNKGESNALRPLTTKEAGNEPMQHLIDALKKIKLGTGNYTDVVWFMNQANKTLEEHKEKMK